MAKTNINKTTMSEKKFSLFCYLVSLFAILPQYIYVFFGVNVVNFCAMVIFLIFILNYRFIIYRNKTFIIFSFYLLFFCIATFITVGFFQGITYFLSFIAIPFFVIFFINTKEQFLLFIEKFVIFGFVLGIFGILEQITKTNLFQMFSNEGVVFFHEFRYGFLRVMTTFGQPISYGIFQVFMFALTLYTLQFTKYRKFFITVLVVSAINVLLTVSRLPIFLLLFISVLFLVKRYKSFGAFILLLVFILLWLLLEIPFFSKNFTFIQDLISTLKSFFSADSSNSGGEVLGIGNRLDLFSWVSNSMDGYWIMGHGSNATFNYFVTERFTKTSIENQYLNILYRNGVIGLVILIILYLSLIVQSAKMNLTHFKAKKDFTFSFVFMILMLGYFVVEFGVQESDMARTFVIIVSLYISYSRFHYKYDEDNSFEKNKMRLSNE